jgi:IS605 OrfB family transposase
MNACMRTFETRILTDESSDHILFLYAKLFAKVERHLFKAKMSNIDSNECKRQFLKQFGMTSRQYNACRSQLLGKIESIKERRKLQISELEEKTKGLESNIKKIKNPLTIHQKKRRLSSLKGKLANLKRDEAQNTIRLCFGSKKLFRAQFALKENGFSSHAEWKKAFEKQRSSQFFVLGSKDETSGNQSCVSLIEEDKTMTLRLRLPDAFAPQYGTYLVIPRVKFAYGHSEIVEALTSKQAISYRFKKDEKGWRVFVSINLIPPPTLSDEKQGAIGIDINSDHLSVVEIDRFGNFIHKQTVPLHLYGKSTNQAKALIGDACKKVVQIAEETKKPLVLEKLDFKQKKATLKEKDAKYARMLSSFAYSSILTHLKSRAQKQRIDIKEVNPAYTSIIGRVKFSKRYGLTIHQAAALVIARRFFRFSEKPPSRLKDIPDGKGGHVAFPLPARNRGKHVWSFWRTLSRKLSVALAAHFRAIKNRSMNPCKTAHAM